MAGATQSDSGSVVSLWRYPVKSMMGEELNATEVDRRGLLGDRSYALVDSSTGKVVSAKNPRKWPHLFDFRASFVGPPHTGDEIPAVRITLPDGAIVTSGQDDLDAIVSGVLGREVTLRSVAPPSPSLEEYWPDIAELAHQETVTDESMPPGAFFDFAVVHVLTTATLDRLRELYPQGRFEIRRFRPNIVIEPPDNIKGFVENDWVGRTLAIGDEVRVSVTGASPRCVMTTLAQGDLPQDRDILRTAAQANDSNVGVYGAVVRGGTIRRGDRVRLE